MGGLGAAFIAFMVARGWGWDRLPPRGETRDQDAGDHKGPLHHPRPYGILGLRLRLMPITLVFWETVTLPVVR